MDKNEELQKWLNDDRYVQKQELSKLWGVSVEAVYSFLINRRISPVRKIYSHSCKRYVFYDRNKCLIERSAFNEARDGILELQNKHTFVRISELSSLWGISYSGASSFLHRMGITATRRFDMGNNGSVALYDRAECERARPFINQPEQKEVEKVEEKQMELPESKEQTPDIIPADTIDLFTMSELESELKNRGVELTTEVIAKINASDMPEMQHIAKMLRGNAKTIAIRLSVLNEIAGQLMEVEIVPRIIKNMTLIEFEDKNGKPGDFYIDRELKPCPFCGDDRISVFCEELKNDYWLAKIECSGCDCKNEHDDDTKEESAKILIDYWNRRSCAVEESNCNELKKRIEELEYIIANTIKTLQTA